MSQEAHSWKSVPPDSGWQEQGLLEKSAKQDAALLAASRKQLSVNGQEDEGEKEENACPPFLYHQKAY